MNALNAEVGKLNGVTQVLVAVAGQSDKSTDDHKPDVKEVVSSAPIQRAKPLVVEKIDVPEVPAADASKSDKDEALKRAQQALETSKRNIEQIRKY